MSTILKGNIVRILDQYRVVINLGKKDGVSENMKFIIYELGEEIRDPIGRKSLGQLELVKGRIKIIHVQEKMSIGESDNYHTEEEISGFAMLMQSKKTTTQMTPLIVEGKPPSDFKSPIKVGDTVRLMD